MSKDLRGRHPYLNSTTTRVGLERLGWAGLGLGSQFPVLSASPIWARQPVAQSEPGPSRARAYCAVMDQTV